MTDQHIVGQTVGEECREVQDRIAAVVSGRWCADPTFTSGRADLIASQVMTVVRPILEELDREKARSLHYIQECGRLRSEYIAERNSPVIQHPPVQDTTIRCTDRVQSACMEQLGTVISVSPQGVRVWWDNAPTPSPAWQRPEWLQKVTA